MNVADNPCYNNSCTPRRDLPGTLATTVVKEYLHFGHIRLRENALSLSAILQLLSLFSWHLGSVVTSVRGRSCLYSSTRFGITVEFSIIFSILK
jgi:hypothetical protein